MNNTALKIIAALLGLGSVVVAYMGWQLSQQPQPATVPPPAVSPSAPQFQVIVAAKALAPGRPISAGDLSNKAVETLPPNAFQAPGDVIGRVVTMPVALGTMLHAGMFQADSVASLLRAGERAVAVQLDEIIGVGGYVQPGDHVDLLYYMQPGHENGEKAIAQTAIHDVRVLTVGDWSQMAQEQAKRNKDSAPTNPLAGDGSSNTEEHRSSNQRSAVLAVPEAQVNRVMLAANTGMLRMALRPRTLAEPFLAEPAPSPTPIKQAVVGQIQLSDLIGSMQKLQAPNPRTTGRNIIIQEGSKERRLEFNVTAAP